MILQECGGSDFAASTFSSFTVASLDVPLGARWTVNQVGSGHATQHTRVSVVSRRTDLVSSCAGLAEVHATCFRNTCMPWHNAWCRIKRFVCSDGG